MFVYFVYHETNVYICLGGLINPQTEEERKEMKNLVVFFFVFFANLSTALAVETGLYGQPAGFLESSRQSLNFDDPEDEIRQVIERCAHRQIGILPVIEADVTPGETLDQLRQARFELAENLIKKLGGVPQYLAIGHRLAGVGQPGGVELYCRDWQESPPVTKSFGQPQVTFLIPFESGIRKLDPETATSVATRCGQGFMVVYYRNLSTPKGGHPTDGTGPLLEAGLPWEKVFYGGGRRPEVGEAEGHFIGCYPIEEPPEVRTPPPTPPPPPVVAYTKIPTSSSSWNFGFYAGGGGSLHGGPGDRQAVGGGTLGVEAFLDDWRFRLGARYGSGDFGGELGVAWLFLSPIESLRLGFVITGTLGDDEPMTIGGDVGGRIEWEVVERLRASLDLGVSIRRYPATEDAEYTYDTSGRAGVSGRFAVSYLLW